MTQTANPSLRELKRETEQTRAGLTQTVEQLRISVSETAGDLRKRMSPEAIKAEVSDYVRSRGERLMEDITSAARRNPVQAVAVGASVTYPLLRLARAIPLPVLMVGAGLFFAGSNAAKDLAIGAMGQANDAVAAGSDQFRQSAASATSELDARTDSLRAGANAARDALISRTRDLKDSVAGAVATTTDGARNLATKGACATR
jgi:hypothetical protein